MLQLVRSKFLRLQGTCLALFLQILLMVLMLLNACSAPVELVEASGVVRVGEQLIIVSDDSAGALFRYELPNRDYHNRKAALLATISIDKPLYQAFTSSDASDLESIDVLPNGQILVLSEQAAALFTKDGLAVQYPEELKELASRGLEGLAIHSDGQVVVLWEGGYYSPGVLPGIFAGDSDNHKLSPKPRFCVHTFPVSPETSACMGENAIRDLEVPSPPDSTQSFRAPDLVWDTDGQSFIVLLASLNAANDAFRYLWLQRFSVSGEPSGAPLNLCDQGILPQQLRDGPESNIEGLAWFDPGESLILINDTKQTATAIVLSVNPWPKTDNTLACDS